MSWLRWLYWLPRRPKRVRLSDTSVDFGKLWWRQGATLLDDDGGVNGHIPKAARPGSTQPDNEIAILDNA